MTGLNAIMSIGFFVISLSGILWFFIMDTRKARRSLVNRINTVGAAYVTTALDRKRGSNTSSRKRSIDTIIEDMAEQKKADQKKSRKVSLHLRMRQGGVMWSRNTYLLITLCLSVIGVLFLYFVYEASPFISACFGIAFGLTVPHAYVSFRRSRRLKLFAKEFPNAVDIVARGLRTGLPLGDCMRIIAQEAASPVKDEFQILVDDQMLGETLSVATENMSHRVPLTEVKFFAIVIAIQNKTGGSLSESFDNLSRVLRERKMMSEKIKSVSQEAKSSAAIIGSLPFMVTLIIYLLDPDYINLLFTTGTGNLVLTLSGVWMLCGIMIMRKMINFDF